MYKNIEILDKKKHEKLKFNTVDMIEVAKNIGVIPLGVNEVLDMSCISPVLISSGESGEFIAFTGVSKDMTVYNKSNLYVPRFIQSYPFFNIVIKDEKGKTNTVVAIDNDTKYIGKNKKNSIFTKNGELENLTLNKIQLVRELHKQRDISKRIIEELKAKELLVKKDFKVKINNEEKTILEEFYIVNRDKLLKLDDATLALWAKKGWIGVIDAHLKSLGNFQKILVNK